jgi:hypothetical protein
MTILEELNYNDISRFNTFFIPGPSNQCWLWLGSIIKDGYGCFYRGKRKRFLAHQVAYFIEHGPFDPLCVLHTCDKSSCVNPNHLFLGTRIDNIKDMDQKNRRTILLGELQGRAKLTDIQVEEIRRKYIPWLVTYKILGKEYGVDPSQIEHIVNNKQRTQGTGTRRLKDDAIIH